MKPVFTVLILIIQTTAMAQRGAKMSGKIVSDDNHQPISFCAISLIKDSAVVKGSISDSAGHYEFEQINEGSYSIMINMTGFELYRSAVFAVDSNGYNVPIISLTPDIKKLGQVTVTAQKKLFEMHPDKIVMNIENSIVVAGNSAFEVLRKAPGITTDKDDNLLLKRAQCQVFIDGRPAYLAGSQLTDYLKTLPADAVSKIEIITNPSSKYDAAGSSGIINVILKKNKAKGLNGSASAGVGYGKYPHGNAGINLNYGAGRFNIFGNGFVGYSESFNQLTYNTIINNNGNVNYQDRSQYWHPYSGWSTFKGGVDYNIGTQSTLGLLIAGNTDHTTANTNDNTTVSDQSHIPFQYISTIKNDATHVINTTYNINYKTEIDTAGSEVTADADYVHYSSASQNTNQANFYNESMSIIRDPYIFRNSQPSDITILSAKTDITYYFKNTLKLEAGLKYSNVKTDNDLAADSIKQKQWVNDSSRSNHFVYTEIIDAGYVSLTKDISKTTIQAGLRAEQTESSGRSVTLNTAQNHSYLDIFPTFYLTQTLNDDHQLNFGYSRRIARPSYQSLNPFVSYIDPYTLFAGNPYLRPVYTNNFEFKHGYKQVLFTTLTYSHSANDQVDGVIQDKASGITTNIPENSSSSDYLTLNVTSSLKITKTWTSDINLNVNYGRDYSTLPGFSYDTYSEGADLNSNNIFILPKNYKVQTGLFYATPTQSGITYIKSSYGWDLGIQKQILNKKLTIKLNATNIIGTSAYRAHILGDNLDINWMNKWEGRRANLSLVWKFGSTSKNSHQHNGTSSDDEKSRIKK